MSPEERFERIERKLDFVAGIQAQMVVAQQKRDTELDRIAKITANNSKDIILLSKAVLDLVRVTNEQGNRMDQYFRQMGKRQDLLEDQLRRTDEQLRRTDERLQSSDKRFDAILALLKRKSSNDRH